MEFRAWTERTKPFGQEAPTGSGRMPPRVMCLEATKAHRGHQKVSVGAWEYNGPSSQRPTC